MSNSTPNIVSKSDFAKLSGVRPARVSQWIKDRKLSGPALVGSGRCARINVPIAQQQLRDRLDPNQMTANGSGTDLGPPTASVQTRSDPSPASSAGLDLTAERARLAAEQADDKAMRNAERRGELINAAEAERRWGEVMIKMRTRLLQIPSEIAAMLPELTAVQLDKIDRAVRDALISAATDDL